jgi:hypothetical protein
MDANLKHNKKHSSHNDLNCLSSIKEFKASVNKLDNVINNSNKKKNYHEYKISTNKHERNDLKKYIGLIFCEYEDNFDSGEDKHFILLEAEKIYIINYSVTISVKKPSEDDRYFVLFGIKDKFSPKINVINGSKIFFEPNNEDNGKIVITNTLIHHNKDDGELYVFAKLDENCTINSKKSCLKIIET